jgi:hypothetical protein
MIRNVEFRFCLLDDQQTWIGNEKVQIDLSALGLLTARIDSMSKDLRVDPRMIEIRFCVKDLYLDSHPGATVGKEVK